MIDAAVSSDEVFIAKDGNQIVQLVPVAQPNGRPYFGSGEGMMVMAEDFDAPSADLAAYMP